MSVEGLSRAQIRARVAQNLLGVDYKQGTTSGNGTGSNLIDNTLRGGDDNHNGKFMLMTSGANDGAERQVDNYVQTGTTLTLAPALGTATVAGDTYEMFDTTYSAGMIHRAINQAITDVTGRFYKREESLFHHTDRKTTRFSLPSEFDMVDKIEMRNLNTAEELASTESEWEVESGAGAGSLIASITISEKDLSALYTHAELWIKSSVALDSGDLELLLDNTAGGGSPEEALAIPAVAAGTWTYVRMPLENPADLEAIVHVSIRMAVDKGVFVLRLDDVKVANLDTASWTPLDKHLWGVDREEQDLVLTPSGRVTAGYHLLKISGGSNPAQMTSDSDVATVNESYLIAKATGLLLLGGSRASDQDPDGRRSLGAVWLGTADREKGKMGPLVNVRKVT